MTMSDYNFAGQYQQAPAPRGGGLVKIDWFKRYTPAQKPAQFDFVFQSWDTANTATTLSDYSVCTTWGVMKENFYLLDVVKRRLEYPELKRLVASHGAHWNAKDLLIEDKASGTQLLQELRSAGVHGATAHKSEQHKVVRMNTVTPTIENGFVYIPTEAPWLMDFLHELAHFPHRRNDDQADSLSQALDWFKSTQSGMGGLFEFYKRKSSKTKLVR